MSEKDLERIKNIYGKRNPKTHIEQRCQRLYTKQLDGLSTRQLVLQHAQREGIAEKTAWSDWKRVTEWNSQDLERDRADILSRLHSMRQRLFNAALKKRPTANCTHDFRFARSSKWRGSRGRKRKYATFAKHSN